MIISGANADAEIEKVVSAHIEDAGLASYAYLRLTEEDFERLSYALAKRSAPLAMPRSWDDAALMVRGADAGRDVLLTSAGTAVGVIQCKRLEGPMALPAVFREMTKLILFARTNGDLKFDRELVYLLSLARDPARTVVDYFARRAELEGEKRDAILAAALEVRDTYAALEALTDVEVEQVVFACLPLLKIGLLRPNDLDEWMGRETAVAGRFFRQRVVVDNTVLSEGLEIIAGHFKDLMSKVDGTAPVTDEDLKLLQQQIEDTPQTHRLNFGIVMLFGLPPEMFVGRPNLEKRIGPLRDLFQALQADYTDWVFALARDKESRIINGAEAMYAHPVARNIPVAFLGFVAKECLAASISGTTVAAIVDRLTNAPRFESDEDRLRHVQAELAREWGRYLAGDFSGLAGDAGLVALKRQVIGEGLRGLASQADLERALATGGDLLKIKLFEAAEKIRAMCKHKISIVLTGPRGIDSEDGVSRLADTVRRLDELKRANGPV